MTGYPAWKTYLKDIRFWIVLLFVARLYGITNPPLDPASTIRQCDVLMIARNFYEVDPNIFFPRIDFEGKAVVVGVEFPIYNYLIYLVSLPFGFDHWYGRLINLVLSSVALLCFYRMLLRFFGKDAAFNATFLLLFSGWLSYARITIPDIFGASLCIIALYFSFKYFENGKPADLLAFTMIALLGCLSKISAASLLTVLIMPILSRDTLLKRKVIMACSAVIVLAVVCTWYYYWVPTLTAIGDTAYFFMGLPVSEAINHIIEEPHLFLKKVYEDPLRFTGSALFIFSVFYAIRLKKFTALLAFLIPLIAFSLFVLKSGKWFYVNGYYFLMLVPQMALIAGFGLSLIQNRSFQLIILSVIAIENIANQSHVFEIRAPYKPYATLEKILDDSGVGKNDLIVVGNADGTPMALYMAHRRGWNSPNDQLKDSNHIADLREAGCKYIVVLRKIYDEDLELPYEIVFNSDDFTVYKL